MLYEPHEVAAIVATPSIVLAVERLGHDPLRAAGALLLEVPGLEQRLVANRVQQRCLSSRGVGDDGVKARWLASD